MPDQQSPFKSEYSKGSQTTSRPGEEGHRLPAAERTPGASQTASVETVILPPVDQLIEAQRYGTGKPRRVVIRGRISRE
jgi:hypothetical protein